MSYCRLSECDVYAYESVIGGVQFYIAGGRRDLDRLCMTYNEAYQYMKTLRDQYELDVPDHAIEALKADAIEEALRICGPNSAVSELKAENAKLLWLVNDMCACFRIGAERDGVSKQWCYELFDSYTGKLRELGIEVDE